MLLRIITIIGNSLEDSFIGNNIALFYTALFGAAFNFVPQIDDWISNNGGYIGFIMYAIALDLVLGIIVAFKHRNFSFKKVFLDLAIKLLAVLGFGVLFEGVKGIYANDLAITDYLLYTVRMMVFLYPVFSASKSMSIITGGAFPPEGWFKKGDAFNKDLDFNKFKGDGPKQYEQYGGYEDNTNYKSDEKLE